MKKLFGVLVCCILVSLSSIGQSKSISQLLGKWEAVDSENSTGGLEVIDTTKIYLVYGTEKKAIASYKADFTKSPASFDFIIKDGSETISLKSLIQFVNDDLIQWQVFEGDVRPVHFTQSGGQTVFLRRKK